jgi:hypothetical protein
MLICCGAGDRPQSLEDARPALPPSYICCSFYFQHYWAQVNNEKPLKNSKLLFKCKLPHYQSNSKLCAFELSFKDSRQDIELEMILESI